MPPRPSFPTSSPTAHAIPPARISADGQACRRFRASSGFLGERVGASRAIGSKLGYIRKHIKETVEASDAKTAHVEPLPRPRASRVVVVMTVKTRGQRETNKGDRRTIRHPPSDVRRRVPLVDWPRDRHAHVATLVGTDASTTLYSRRRFAPPPAKTAPPPSTRGGGCCVGRAGRNWVRQTRGRPSQAEARESSRRFRLEAVPWKPPRSPSPLRQSVDDPPLSPSLPPGQLHPLFGSIPRPPSVDRPA